ncbi:MAG: MFS transporter, partial [Acetobacteraceae bacterium]|nr:MFS transporter [Acetobacteraceae bacterium]
MRSEAVDETQPGRVARSQRALDWLNFFIADVETAFGPFVAVWLSSQGWSQGAIGLLISINTGIALATQMPAGWLVDHIKHKRVVLGVSLACIAGGALLIALFPQTWLVGLGEAMHGVTGGTVRLAIAAIGLGLVGHKAYSRRVGRNHRYDSIGNAATAGSMGVAGHFLSLQAPFFIGAGLCVPAAIAMFFISGKEIDPTRARQGKKDVKAGRWRDLLRNRPLMMFALVLFLFQFANASLLPLAGERLAADHAGQSELVTAALVVVPQLVTAVIATWIARRSDDWGRRVMLAAALGALLLRSVLFALAVSP